jgi:hypothetical protein
MSFSLDLAGDYKDYAGESRQDYNANSTPMFVTSNIKDFYELMKYVSIATGSFKYVPNPFYLKTALYAKKFSKEFERTDSRSYATEEYGSNISSVHGRRSDGRPKYISKFRLVPCDGKGRQAESSEGKAANYLQAEIAARAEQGQICFLYQIQILDLKKLQQNLHSDWSAADFVENGGELWPENILHFHTVAKIEVRKGSKEVNCQERYINPRLHSNPENMPVGSIARVRAEVEENSRARRQGDMK